MGEPTLRWGNVERAVVAYLKPLVGVEVLTETASSPGATTGGEYLTVNRVGGTTEWISKDVDIEVTVNAPARGRMWDLAADVESAMWALAAHAAGDLYVDDVAEAFGFADDPPPAQGIRRAIATYTLTVRPI